MQCALGAPQWVESGYEVRTPFLVIPAFSRHSRESGNPAKQAKCTRTCGRPSHSGAWNRAWKLELIEAENPDWRDLAEDFGFPPVD
jgi:hypothetical protein